MFDTHLSPYQLLYSEPRSQHENPFQLPMFSRFQKAPQSWPGPCSASMVKETFIGPEAHK